MPRTVVRFAEKCLYREFLLKLLKIAVFVQKMGLDLNGQRLSFWN